VRKLPDFSEKIKEFFSKIPDFFETNKIPKNIYQKTQIYYKELTNLFHEPTTSLQLFNSKPLIKLITINPKTY